MLAPGSCPFSQRKSIALTGCKTPLMVPEKLNNLNNLAAGDSQIIWQSRHRPRTPNLEIELTSRIVAATPERPAFAVPLDHLDAARSATRRSVIARKCKAQQRGLCGDWEILDLFQKCWPIQQLNRICVGECTRFFGKCRSGQKYAAPYFFGSHHAQQFPDWGNAYLGAIPGFALNDCNGLVRIDAEKLDVNSTIRSTTYGFRFEACLFIIL
jgi:hypothetical protein